MLYSISSLSGSVTASDTVIHSSFDLVNRLNRLGVLPGQRQQVYLMTTFDFESLYPSLRIEEEILDAIRYLSHSLLSINPKSVHELLARLRYLLRSNYIRIEPLARGSSSVSSSSFLLAARHCHHHRQLHHSHQPQSRPSGNNSRSSSYFHQKQGIAMGVCYAPALANLTLLAHEIRYFNKQSGHDQNCNSFFCHHQVNASTAAAAGPAVLFRYIDDGILLTRLDATDLESLDLIQDSIEQTIKSIYPGHHRFTFEHSTRSIHFLDLLFQQVRTRTNQYQIKTRTYFKFDATPHINLNYHTNLPKSTKRNAIHTQLIRYSFLSSDYRTFTQTAKKLFAHLHQNQSFPSRILTPFKHRLSHYFFFVKPQLQYKTMKASYDKISTARSLLQQFLPDPTSQPERNMKTKTKTKTNNNSNNSNSNSPIHLIKLPNHPLINTQRLIRQSLEQTIQQSIPQYNPFIITPRTQSLQRIIHSRVERQSSNNNDNSNNHQSDSVPDSVPTRSSSSNTQSDITENLYKRRRKKRKLNR